MQASIGLLRDVFGDSKEIAIAQAIINTYAGATKALEQGGVYGIALAALVVASGLAQVAKIASTEPGGGTGSDATSGRGFDDRRNDAMAYMGGQRWAADMVGEWTRGASAGWASGMRGVGGGVSNTTTYDNRKSTNVHFHNVGLMDASDARSVVKLKRMLDVADKQFDQQRKLLRAK